MTVIPTTSGQIFLPDGEPPQPGGTGAKATFDVIDETAIRLMAWSDAVDVETVVEHWPHWANEDKTREMRTLAAAAVIGAQVVLEADRHRATKSHNESNKR